MRRWYRLRRIGTAGHPWTEAMLANYVARHGSLRPVIAGLSDIESDDEALERLQAEDDAEADDITREIWPSLTGAFASPGG